MASLFTEVPNGASGGWFLKLTPLGRLVWDGEHGALLQAEMVVRCERRGLQLTPDYMRARGVPSVVVHYDSNSVGVSPTRKRKLLLDAHMRKPIRCMQPGVEKALRLGT